MLIDYTVLTNTFLLPITLAYTAKMNNIHILLNNPGENNYTWLCFREKNRKLATE